jgi:hypothetical protein
MHVGALLFPCNKINHACLSRTESVQGRQGAQQTPSVVCMTRSLPWMHPANQKMGQTLFVPVSLRVHLVKTFAYLAQTLRMSNVLHVPRARTEMPAMTSSFRQVPSLSLFDSFPSHIFSHFACVTLQCALCESGKFAPEPGAVECQSCRQCDAYSQLCSLTTDATCMPGGVAGRGVCPIGWEREDDNKTCIMCARGYLNMSNACVQCPANFFCSSKQDYEACQVSLLFE